MAKRIPVLVTAPTFVNSVLHLPGETAYVDLDELGVKSLDDDSVLGLEANKGGEDAIQMVPVAPVTAFAPGSTDPQQIPPGTRTSGTGRQLSPATPEQDDLSVEMSAPATDDATQPAKG